MKRTSLFIGFASVLYFPIHGAAAPTPDSRVQVTYIGSIETIVYELDNGENVAVWIDDDGLVDAVKNSYTEDGMLREKWCTQPVSVSIFRSAVATDLEAFRCALVKVLTSVAVDEALACALTDLIAPLPVLSEEIHKEPLLKIPLASSHRSLPLSFLESHSPRGKKSSSRSPSGSASNSPRNEGKSDSGADSPRGEGSPRSDGKSGRERMPVARSPRVDLSPSTSPRSEGRNDSSADSPRSEGSPRSAGKTGRERMPVARSPRLDISSSSSPHRDQKNSDTEPNFSGMGSRLHKSTDSADL
jgi:hypothetical protein